MQVKALACEFPSRVVALVSLERGGTRLPCPRLWSHSIPSDAPIWGWLNEDAIRPWRHRCWKGRKLRVREFVLSADEKTSIQARSRESKSLPPQPGSADEN